MLKKEMSGGVGNTCLQNTDKHWNRWSKGVKAEPGRNDY